MVAATFVDSKGATPYAVKLAAAFLKNLGYRKVVLKWDGERSIMALKEAEAREAAIESGLKSLHQETTKRTGWLTMQSAK